MILHPRCSRPYGHMGQCRLYGTAIRQAHPVSRWAIIVDKIKHPRG